LLQLLFSTSRWHVKHSSTTARGLLLQGSWTHQQPAGMLQLLTTSSQLVLDTFECGIWQCMQCNAYNAYKHLHLLHVLACAAVLQCLQLLHTAALPTTDSTDDSQPLETCTNRFNMSLTC
jgi:hypothetical protein